MGRTAMNSPTKKKRGKKDVNKPKRATSAYFFFLAQCREDAKRTGKNISKIAEFTKEASAQWRVMSAAQKKPFDDRALKDKARYDTEMAAFKGKIVDPNKPKRPQTAYFLFLGDFRKSPEVKGIAHKEIIKMAGEKWRQMTDKDKMPYEQQSQTLQKKYDEDLKKWREGGTSGATAAAPVQKANNGMEEEDEDEDDDDEEEDDDDEEEEDDE